MKFRARLGTLCGPKLLARERLPTIRKARRELENDLVDWDSQCVRRPGGGRRRIEQSHPEVLVALKKLVEDETAGDPSSAEPR